MYTTTDPGLAAALFLLGHEMTLQDGQYKFFVDDDGDLYANVQLYESGGLSLEVRLFMATKDSLQKILFLKENSFACEV